MTWIIWLLIGLAALYLNRGCGWACRPSRRLAHDRDETRALRRGASEPGSAPTERWDTRQPAHRRALSPGPARAAETPLQRLQRQFVSGALTMEQYEAALDKLDRLD
ncbi:MAG: hypothetical protein ACE5HQ_09095 [Gemmatimonadota bacterium]